MDSPQQHYKGLSFLEARFFFVFVSNSDQGQHLLPSPPPIPWPHFLPEHTLTDTISVILASI